MSKRLFISVVFLSIWPLKFVLGEENSCPWIATYGKTVEEVANEVKIRTGKTPNNSCGGGTDFKVCTECADRLTDKQWRKVQLMLADPAFRQWHMTWHRNSFQKARDQSSLKKGADLNTIMGENFLFLHREIYKSVQANLAANGLPCILPWAKLPQDADDKVWPNDRGIQIKREKELCDSATPKDINKIKTFLDSFTKLESSRIKELEDALNKLYQSKTSPKILFTLRENLINESEQVRAKYENDLLGKNWLTKDILEKYKECILNPPEIASANKQQKSFSEQVSKNSSPDYLKAKNLGAVGNDINNSWHGELHYTYGIDNPVTCDQKNTDVSCQSMAQAISSHVNIHFYKAHGLIDRHIDRWLDAHGYDIASSDCGTRSRCFQWSGTYVGELPDFVSGKGCTLASKQTNTNPNVNGNQ